MPTLGHNLDLDRCPHCSIAHPNLRSVHHFETNDYKQQNRRFWHVYKCERCGGVVTAAGSGHDQQAREVYPAPREVDTELPETAREYLQQAINSLHAPAGAVLLAGSAVDAMLKKKGYTEGSLYSRIDKAAEDHVITAGMAEWAHDVRLDANDQRHAEANAALPNGDDAKRATDFASALGDFLFVLPSRVQRGLDKSKQTQ